MAGKTYNAGTIFLQVVPVFGDVQRAISSEAKDWNAQLGDEMEKGGRKAGERAGKAMAERMGQEMSGTGEKHGDEYGRSFQRQIVSTVQRAQKAIDGIDFRTASDNSLRDLERVKKALKDLGDTEITADFNSKKALAQIEILRGTIDSLVKGDHEIEITADLLKARAELKAIGAEADKIVAKQREIKIGAIFESKMADRQMGAFEKRVRETARRAAGHLGDSMSSEIRKIKAELESIANSEIGIDVSSEDAMRKLEALQREARRLSLMSPNIDVKVDAGKAEAELAGLMAAVRKIDGKDINIRADVNSGAAVAKMGILESLLSARNGSDAAANSFRSFNAIILAAVTLLPALIPVLGAVGGGLLALVPIMASVGAGLGSVLIGFSGIGNALTALGNQADQAAYNSSQAGKTMEAAAYAVVDAKSALADAERNAARAAQDSARQVADARRSAAEAIASALDRQKEAQQSYRDSVKEVQDAEKALADARKQAVADQADTQAKIKQNQLDIRQGVLDLFTATTKNNATQADGASTNFDKEQAQVTMLQAQQRLAELRATQQDLAKEAADQAQQGVNGNTKVQQAQDALTKALENQQKAQDALGKAAKAVTKARLDGARRVADAVRNQQRAEADGARNVARAQEQLRRAQEAYGQALYQTSEIGSAAARNVEAAMSKLGPAGQKFARWLFGMREAWYKFRDSLQQALLPKVQSALQSLISTYGPKFSEFMTRMASVAGGLFEALSASLQGPAWKKFFATMDALGPKMLAEFGMSTIKWMEAFASIMTAVAPFAERMSTAMLGIANAVANWAASADGQGQITKFMEYAASVGPDVVSFLEAFVKAAWNLGVALAPWGKLVLDALTGLLNWIAQMDPKTLGIIAAAILGIFIAFQAAVGIVALLTAGSTIFATTLGTIVFVALAVVGTLAALSIHFEFVRKAMKKVGDLVKNHIDLFVNLAKVVAGAYLAFKTYRAMLALVKSIQLGMAAATYGAAGATYAVGAAAKIAYGITRAWAIAQAIFNAVMAANPIVLLAIGIGLVIAALVYAYFHFTKFRNLVDTVFGFFRSIVEFVFKAIVGYWKNILWPILDLIGTVIWKLWKFEIKVALGLIKGAWKNMVDAMAWAWKNVLKPVFDAIIEKLGGKKGLQKAFETVVSAIKTAWDTIKKIVGEPIKFVINTVIRDGLVAGFNKVAKFVGSDPMKFEGVDWKFARGGVMPGYTPGRDVHHFSSPTGGRLHLSGGEAIMRPEFTRAMGPQWVNQMNAVAATGGVNGVRKALGGQAYAKGGVYLPQPDDAVLMNGMRISRIAAAQVALAKKLFGINFYLMQGGYGGNNVAASGTSHNYPGVGDFGPGTIQSETALRKVGFAAWARNIAGRMMVGSGAHVHAASLLDPGNRNDPQITGSWPNHGNGLSGYNNDPAPHPSWVPNLLEQVSKVTGSDIKAIASAATGNGGGGASFPSWIINVAKGPLDYVKGLISKPINAIKDKFGENSMVKLVTSLPKKLARGMAHKVIDMIPDSIKSVAGVVGNAIEGVGHAASDVGHGIASGIGKAGDALGFARGGILPYNGTMMYDSGGYLPPGLTSVVNLTGRPEPVFTADQFSRMENGGQGGAAVHYEPHFHKSDLTARDVAFDLDIEFDRLSRKSARYGGSN